VYDAGTLPCAIGGLVLSKLWIFWGDFDVDYAGKTRCLCIAYGTRLRCLMFVGRANEVPSGVGRVLEHVVGASARSRANHAFGLYRRATDTMVGSSGWRESTADSECEVMILLLVNYE
jgi:hypothetical protein